MVIVRPSYRIWRVNIIVVLNYKPFWLKRERERGMVLALSRFYGEEKSNVNWWLLSCLSWDDKGLYNLPLDQILGWPITREGLKECGNSISLSLYKQRKHSTRKNNEMQRLCNGDIKENMSHTKSYVCFVQGGSMHLAPWTHTYMDIKKREEIWSTIGYRAEVWKTNTHTPLQTSYKRVG